MLEKILGHEKITDIGDLKHQSQLESLMTTEGDDQPAVLASSASQFAILTGGDSDGESEVTNNVHAIHNNYMEQLEGQYNDS